MKARIIAITAAIFAIVLVSAAAGTFIKSGIAQAQTASATIEQEANEKESVNDTDNVQFESESEVNDASEKSVKADTDNVEYESQDESDSDNGK